MRIRDPKTTALIFASGKMVCSLDAPGTSVIEVQLYSSTLVIDHESYDSQYAIMFSKMLLLCYLIHDLMIMVPKIKSVSSSLLLLKF